MIETVCAGINTYMVCTPINGILLGDNAINLPERYRNWKIEKVVYSPQDDKVYVQISYSNLRKVITL